MELVFGMIGDRMTARLAVLFLLLPLLFLGLAFPGLAGAASEAAEVGIDLFDLKTGTLVYRAKRVTRNVGGKIAINTIYSKPDGTEVQRSESVYETGSLKIASFRMTDNRFGSLEEIRVSDGKVKLLHRAKAGEETKTEELEWADGLATTATVVEMMARNLDTLKKGEPLSFDLIVPSRLETIGFRLKKDSEAELGGQPVIVIRMEPDSWLIRQLVDPMYFYVTGRPHHRLLEYRGRVSVKTDEGEPQDLKMVYRYPAKP